MDEIRRQVLEGRIELPRIGEVRQADPSTGVPFAVVVNGIPVEPITAYLIDLVLSDMSPLTIKSYAHDLLRWWKVLAAVDVAWHQASRTEVELLVGWLRCAANPQRRRADLSAPQAGSVNVRTGKPLLVAGYAASTINHALTVISEFYEFHLLYGRGPLLNPVPTSPGRRRLVGHRNPLEPPPRLHRPPLRQKKSQRAPRSLPDQMWDELFAAMRHDRDRALLSFAVSSGARANELLGVTGDRVDWGSQRIWVVSKGTRELSAVPGSPAAFDYLARYFDRCGTPGPAEQIWRTLRGDTRPLTYWAFRRIMQRANEILGTNWTLHDLRHTAAVRMANDPQLTLPEVQTILRHQHLSTTEGYLQPRIEELHDKLREHFTRPRPQVSYAAGYRDEDIEAVFGARD